jgi:hypothetical protein
VPLASGPQQIEKAVDNLAALPKDLPPKSTVHHYFKLWDWDGTLERIHHTLYVAVRDGVAFVLNASTRALFPFLERIFADGGYQGPPATAAAAATGEWILEIVKRNELHKFVVLLSQPCRRRDFKEVVPTSRMVTPTGRVILQRQQVCE